MNAHHVKKRHPRIAIGLTLAATVSIGATVGWNLTREDSHRSSARTFVHLDDKYPSDYPEDWTSHAEHVVTVTAMREDKVEPLDEELERGEGIIGRVVNLRVEEVLWSQDGAPRVPETVQWDALGWSFSDGDLSDPVPMVASGTPRVEVGHKYVIALNFEDDRCDDPEAGTWTGLGSGGVLPADEGVLGVGESEGVIRDGRRAKTTARTPNERSTDAQRPIAESMVGQDASQLIHLLETADPDQTRRGTSGACG